MPGSHRAIAQAAVSLATSPTERFHLRRLEEMRRNRNQSEYGSRIFGAQEVRSDLEHARWIIEFGRSRMAPP